ncbi:MAG: DUF4153 domain-containing protein [Tabrizicola sp.]|uniref:DUF4153 domain-containing protein n=1 Tax=Tabrizicola sp. TaxID=2005166 RepID=UPI0027350780|nr:DUF4153 domain-containing protein [Tabrizicola sp.]MDP3263686.1 DUF4153 domain-containing protein [Tabrizicola sp.]MDP3647050.1 DUF4153 domain-containing protein [Paracoccaceae bacterium]MDZ4066843.1 DUF4153 domain-containing protein [Tabrizicola sp.]
MDGTLRERWGLALVGALAGGSLYGLTIGIDGILPDRVMLALIVLAGTFFATLLAMAGPIGVRRAALNAAGLALVTAGLVWLASLRFEAADGFFYGPLPTLAALTVATLPMPFLMARAGPGWRDYPSLFLQAWSIVVRYVAAWAFTGLVWVVILLSDRMLGIVGLTVINDLLAIEVVPFVLTGAIVGLAMAVVHEFADLLSPYVVLRLFRLLLPVVLVVMTVFLVALPFRGLSGLFQDWSPALVLLAMVAAGISLVSIAVDQSDADATSSPFLRLAAQAQALVLPVVAGFGAWAVWLRVAQYGWTPERVFVALVAAMAVAYGGIYAVAVLRRGAWMARIRAGNLWMALAVIALAALWLTPVLNAERISARDQLARFEAGRTSVEALDIAAIGRWGKAGAAVIAALEEKAKSPGQEALAARLANPGAEPGMSGDKRAEMVADLTSLMPLQPASATGTRDMIFAAMQEYELSTWLDACKRVQTDGRPGCVLAVADLLPTMPGEEAMVVLVEAGDYAQVYGLYFLADGSLAQRTAVRSNGTYPSPDEARALLRTFQDQPPAVAPALLNQLGTGETGLLILP